MVFQKITVKFDSRFLLSENDFFSESDTSHPSGITAVLVNSSLESPVSSQAALISPPPSLRTPNTCSESFGVEIFQLPTSRRQDLAIFVDKEKERNNGDVYGSNLTSAKKKI